MFRSIYASLIVAAVCVAGCGKGKGESSSDGPDDTPGPAPAPAPSPEGANICERTALPETPPAAGQLVFSLPSSADPCSVSGYVVGFKDQLKVSSAGEGKYFISNVPGGDHDIIITAGTVAASTGLTGDSAKDRGKRLKKVKFLNGVRTEPGEIDLPKFGSITGVAKLLNQADHAGIDVYVPGTDIIAKTDSEGKFSLSAMPVGEHNLYFDKDGYHRGQVEAITVESKKATELEPLDLAISTGAEGFILIDSGAQVATSRVVRLTIGSSPDAVLMKVAANSSFENVGWTPAKSVDKFTFETDGNKTLYVKFADANGLESSPFSATIDVRQVAVLRPGADYNAATTLGTKAFIAGGGQPADGESLNAVDIIDGSTRSWAKGTLSQKKYALAATAVGTKAMFAGGYAGGSPSGGGAYSAVVDIYDGSSKAWSTEALSQARAYLSAVSVGTKALFAGGNTGTGNSNVVDIFDSSTSAWSTATLSGARNGMGAAAVGGVAIFAGGDASGGYSDKIDIYNVNSGTWSTATLSEGRGYLAGASAGTKALFAGGILSGSESDNVDIYDSSDGSWTTATLSQARHGLTAVSVGTKAFFAGGYRDGSGTRSNVVDIYDSATNTWSTATLSKARGGLAAAVAGPLVLFAGGSEDGGGRSVVIDVYDSETGTWKTSVAK